MLTRLRQRAFIFALASRRWRFALDFVALLTSRSAAQLLTIAVGLALVRLMADAVFGAYSLATTSIGLAGVVADFGLDVILTRDIAAGATADSQHAVRLLRQACVLRIVLALFTTLAMVLLALLTSTAGRIDLLLFGGLSLAPRGLMRAVTAVLTGLGRVRDAALIEGIAAFATALATVVLVGMVTLAHSGTALPLLGDSATAAIWGLLVGNLFGLAAALGIGRFASDPNGAGDSTAARPGAPHPVITLLLAALPFMIVGLAGAAFQSLDIYVVKALYWHPVLAASGKVPGQVVDALALYAAPFRIVNALLLVPTAWGVVALPRYVRYVRKTGALRLALRRDLRINLLMGAGLSTACTVFAYPLTVLALGKGYMPAAPILAILCWMTLPVCLSAPYIAALTAQHDQSRIAASVVIAGLIALLANVGLVGLAPDRGSVDGLLMVAGVKVVAMVLLSGFYYLAYLRTPHAKKPKKMNVEV